MISTPLEVFVCAKKNICCLYLFFSWFLLDLHFVHLKFVLKKKKKFEIVSITSITYTTPAFYNIQKLNLCSKVDISKTAWITT